MPGKQMHREKLTFFSGVPYLSTIDCHQSLISNLERCFFKNGPTRHFLSFIMGLFKQTSSLHILQQIYMKNVHPVYGAGIRTHNLWNISLLL